MKKVVKVFVFVNGNILYREDVDWCMEVIGCDGVMIVEGNLFNFVIFMLFGYFYVYLFIMVFVY